MDAIVSQSKQCARQILSSVYNKHIVIYPFAWDGKPSIRKGPDHSIIIRSQVGALFQLENAYFICTRPCHESPAPQNKNIPGPSHEEVFIIRFHIQVWLIQLNTLVSLYV